MKKNPPLFSIVLALSLLFLSCSKDIPATNEQDTSTTNKSKTNTTGTSSRINPIYFGSISGSLVPIPDKAVIRASNDHYLSEEMGMNADGSFIVPYLKPDEYSLLIMYGPSNQPDYRKFRVTNIIVAAGQEIKLGQIILPGN